MKNRIKIALAGVALVGVALLAGCSSAATVTNENITTAAENFEISRKVTFINGITGEALLTIEGRCNIEDQGTQLEVICKTSDESGVDQYKKHFLGLSDNTFYTVEQLESVAVDDFNYRVIFRPEVLIPDIEVSTSNDEDSN